MEFFIAMLVLPCFTGGFCGFLVMFVLAGAHSFGRDLERLFLYLESGPQN